MIAAQIHLFRKAYICLFTEASRDFFLFLHLPDTEMITS